MEMCEEMTSPNALQALELSASHLPILLSALETKQNGQSIDDMNDIAIRMFETHRRRPDPSETFRAAEPPAAEEIEEETPSGLYDEEGGPFG